MSSHDVERLSRCAEIIERQFELLAAGEIDAVVELEKEKMALFEQVDWARVREQSELFESAVALQTQQGVLEEHCLKIRSELATQLSDLARRGKAIAAYKA